MNKKIKKSIKVIYIIQKGRYRFIFYANSCVFGASNKPRERLSRKQKKRSNGKYHKTLSKQTFTY
jgi:hypothetical protein